MKNEVNQYSSCNDSQEQRKATNEDENAVEYVVSFWLYST
jgi:hypothetical protein